ncbi:hypothetical protein [Microbacterium rhizomatis]|uniref:Uncharacterized protein n=1 Tax=Microbacterium rhizomatis TaxID=1631477 RepID=A0A5J5J9P2_9MICO|nr:hypothetical protein [Microbacterium rhizomatis]KAA9111518.1 hypothetical protein F6B43_08125 [Microbacterium rhizomatis]
MTGQDDAAETVHPDAGVGGAVVQGTDADTSSAGVGEQSEPAMDLDTVTDQERIDGILAQTRVDVGDEDAARIAEVLRQRFEDAGIPASADELASFAEGLVAG